MREIKQFSTLLRRVQKDEPVWAMVSGRAVGKTPVGIVSVLMERGLMRFPTTADVQAFDAAQKALNEPAAGKCREFKEETPE